MAEIEGAPTRRGPTLRDVARHAQVSVATVSRALTSDYPVAEPTRAKVLQAVEELHYVVTSRAPKRSANAYMPHEEMGKAAVRLAVERPAPGSGREHQLLGTHIVIRTSVRPLPGGAQA